MITVPTDYDVIDDASLDVVERHVTDDLGIDLQEWGAFRRAIKTGTEVQYLHFLQDAAGNLLCTVPVDLVERAYEETGKTHYEMVRSLGFAHLSRNQATQLHAGVAAINTKMQFDKSVKDFYFHLGSFLDSLSRLMFIFNRVQNVTTAGNRERVNFGNESQMNSPTLVQNPTTYPFKYLGTFLAQLREIKNVRNAITHSWKIPEIIANNLYHYPSTVRTQTNFQWWHEDPALVANVEAGTVALLPILQMLENDYQTMIQYQSFAFGILRADIPAFEHNHGVEIRDNPR